MKKIFVSYSHQQSDCVWRRLVPVLRTAAIDVSIDAERFRAGESLWTQMDREQNQADQQLLCLSNAYLKSKFCQREMKRAVAQDPAFTLRKVIPVLLEPGVALPHAMQSARPLHVNLNPGATSADWGMLLDACGADLQADPLSWLHAAESLTRALTDMQCMNLVVADGVEWRPLLRHLIESTRPAPLVPDLKLIDLNSGRCAARRGLLGEVLRQLAVHVTLPDAPDDLVEFDRRFDALPATRLALTHFDIVGTPDRQRAYGDDLFAALQHLATERRKLSLLVVSKRPFATFLPAGHPVSAIPMDLVELKARR